MSHKKLTDPASEMEKLITEAVELAIEPFAPDRDISLPSLRSVAEQLGTTPIRARKILITAGYFSTPIATKVQELKAAGRTIEEIGEELSLGPAAVYGYIPYEVRAYNLPQVSANADRHKRYRSTRKLATAVKNEDWSEALWKAIVVFQDYPFTISRRGSREGTRFRYMISKEADHALWDYDEKNVERFDNELRVDVLGEKENKSIPRSDVELAFRIYLELLKNGDMVELNKINVYGAEYLLPIFQRILESS